MAPSAAQGFLAFGARGCLSSFGGQPPVATSMPVLLCFGPWILSSQIGAKASGANLNVEQSNAGRIGTIADARGSPNWNDSGVSGENAPTPSLSTGGDTAPVIEREVLQVVG
jgi:hypothetical protein